jgi:hypothetical protein
VTAKRRLTSSSGESGSARTRAGRPSTSHPHTASRNAAPHSPPMGLRVRTLACVWPFRVIVQFPPGI